MSQHSFSLHHFRFSLSSLLLTFPPFTFSDIDFCYAVLHKVSRSFAVVIQQLPEELRDAVCIFYLVLRGLDSVEDDMSFDIAQKLPLLRAFHDKLEISGWNIAGVGDSNDYRELMAAFQKVIAVYSSLKAPYRAVIKDITKRMGAGMAEFAEATHKSGEGSVLSTKQYDLYCHYVAGLVGIGLSQLFSASGLEDANLKSEERLANSMGLFLQKTNIIRDYLEDLEQKRTWWPKEIWSQYAPSLDWFAKNPDDSKSRACLNHMVTDALSHVPDVMSYLSQLKTPSIFEFCAIPQVMAMATLAKLYNNNDVFKKVVKIRKGLSCEMMLGSNSISVVHTYFRAFATDIASKIDINSTEQLAPTTLKLTQRVLYLTRPSPSTIAANKNGVFTWATQATTMCAVVLALWWWK